MSEPTTRQVAPGMPAAAPSADAATMMRYDAYKKSALVAYLLWFVLGGLGAHRFYLRNTASAIVLLVITVTCIAATIVSLGLLGILLIVPLVWVVVDAFLIPGKVRQLNARLIRELSGELPDEPASAS